MGAITARLLDELGYDPDDPAEAEAGAGVSVADLTSGRAGLACASIVRARGEAGESVAVARLASGRLVVVADRCPHDGGRISDGFVEGERIVCARHQWELEVSEAGHLCRHRSLTSCKLRE